MIYGILDSVHCRMYHELQQVCLLEFQQHVLMYQYSKQKVLNKLRKCLGGFQKQSMHVLLYST